LLIASGLFVRSLANLKSVDPGFRIEQLASFAVDPTLNAYSQERTRAFYEDLRDRLDALPFVSSSGYAVMRILEGIEWDSTVTVEGYQAQQGEDMNPHFNAVSPGYFATLGIPLLAGRDFAVSDVLGAEKVCIVNEAFVRKYFEGREAVGRHIGQGGDPGTPLDMQIVGVIKDANYESLREVIPRQVYLPFGQMTSATGVVFYARTSEPPEVFFRTVRSVVRQRDESLPLYELRTLDQQVDRSLIAERMVASLSVAFGVVASALAAIGLYGVMAFTVARRAPEIGIRIALGAESRNVIGMVMREVSVLVLIGVGIALPCYFGLAGLVRSQLYGIAPSDAVSIAAAALILATFAGVAGYLPARRAARVDPLQVLRSE
jgi:predicted permease